MSSILPRTPTLSNWLVRALERDYCPAAEPYIAWLRQPVGWFVVATLASVLVGVTISPLALSLAAGLLALLSIGLAYPWLAVRLAGCELVSQRTELEEDELHEVEVRVRNRCPWPLWGLIIEGFVVSPTDDVHDDDEPSADIALGYVPWLSQAAYRLSIRPRMRGRYPLHSPQLTCAFPFGLWTARRKIENVAPLVVQPKRVKLTGMMEQVGRTSQHGGTGSRSGGQGDFLGLRDYRIGDSIRHVHWAHTARLDSLVVCERAAAEQSPWNIVLHADSQRAGSILARENLAWRVRIAASLCTLLYQQSVAFQLTIQAENESASLARRSHEGNRLTQAIERLIDIPLDGWPDASATDNYEPVGQAACSLIIDTVANSEPNLIRLRLIRAAGNWRQSAEPFEAVIDLDQPIAMQVNAWLQRISHGRQAA